MYKETRMKNKKIKIKSRQAILLYLIVFFQHHLEYSNYSCTASLPQNYINLFIHQTEKHCMFATIPERCESVTNWIDFLVLLQLSAHVKRFSVSCMQLLYALCTASFSWNVKSKACKTWAITLLASPYIFKLMRL